MKKLLLALFALALVVAFTAPSYAADFKYSGFFRIRAFSSNNLDRNEDMDDSSSGLDALSRPRFTATTDKGKIWAMWEIDWYENKYRETTEGERAKKADVTGTNQNVANANAIFGRTGGRVGVGTNRWVVDFAVPGSALRARWGRTDYTSPDGEIFDSNGSSRRPGIGVYGKLSKNMSLSMFMQRSGTSSYEDPKTGAVAGGVKIGSTDDNVDNYYAAVGVKVSPTTTLTPWVALSRDGKGKSLTYAALHAKAKVGIFNVSATGVSVGGDASADKDASGWAMLVRSSASMGKLKLMANLTMLSGDDENWKDEGESEVSDFSRLFPGTGALRTGILISGRGNGSVNDIQTPGRVGGNGITNGKLGKTNGAVVGELALAYAVSKTLKLGAGIHVYESAEDDGMGNSDYGTEFDAGMFWKIYPKLELRAGFAYLAAGDYGKAADKDNDDSWMAMMSLRHAF